MKLTKFANLLVIGLVLTIAASGCRKKPVGVTQLPGYKGQPVGDEKDKALKLTDDNKPSDAAVNGISANDPNLHKDWTQNAEILKAHTVHFAFDSSVVKASEQVNVSAVAAYLKDHAEAAVQVDGHCDERGTAGYNMSLGERRAGAVREDLVGMGVDSKRVDTKSWGFEKPIAQGHDESAWSQNRRGEFIVLTPPGK